MSNLVVMKFGGTSVEDATAINRTAGIVRGRHAKGLTPIVVVSAMARGHGSAPGSGQRRRPGRPRGRVGNYGAAAEPAS